MAFSRRLGVIGILSVSWLVAVGCSDDDNKNVVGEGGEAGEAGESSGGKSTSGGSANNAGKGGNASAGKGGTTGGGMPSAGTANGGSAGTATGGTAGSDANGGAGALGGDDAGGAGGVPGGAGAGGASAGAGGTGEGGAGGAPATLKSCGNQCEIDADCAKPDAPPQKCDQVSHRCYNAGPVECTTHAECIPGASVWLTNCANDAECATGESCVAVGDLGYCAALPVQDSCDFGLEPTTLARFGAVGNVSVCANTYSRCRAGACDSLNCADPLFGGEFCVDSGDGDSCNADTGLCECTVSTECNSGVCGANKHCAQCAVDEDCLGGGSFSGIDVCVNGSCGCSSASVCPDLTQAGVPVCE